MECVEVEKTHVRRGHIGADDLDALSSRVNENGRASILTSALEPKTSVDSSDQWLMGKRGDRLLAR